MCCVSLVECYVSELHKQDQAAGQGVYAVPTGAHVKDNEQVMSLVLGPSFFHTLPVQHCQFTVSLTKPEDIPIQMQL